MESDSSSSRRGGVLLRIREAPAGRQLGFVSADLAVRVIELSTITRVPGVRPPALGIALADGDVVTVLKLVGDPERLGPVRRVTTDRPFPRSDLPVAMPPRDPDWLSFDYRPGSDWPVPGSDRAVLCVVAGQRFALTGGTVVATGVFEADPDGPGILWRSEPVPPVDVRGLYNIAESAIWAERAARSAERRVSVMPSALRTATDEKRSHSQPPPTERR